MNWGRISELTDDDFAGSGFGIDQAFGPLFVDENGKRVWCGCGCSTI
jgi:hypothetical protein